MDHLCFPCILSLNVIEEKNKPFLSAWQDRLSALKNVPPVLGIVWKAAPSVVVLGLVCRVLVSLVPVSIAKVAGLIIDQIKAIVDQRAHLTPHLWWLVGTEFALAVGGKRHQPLH